MKRAGAVIALLVILVLAYQLAVGGLKVGMVDGKLQVDPSGFAYWLQSVTGHSVAEQTPYAPSSSNPTPLPFGTCQLMVNGHNARISVGGPGVGSGVCSSLLPSLGSGYGWTISGSPPATLPTSNVICAIPPKLLPANDQGVVTDSGFFGPSIGVGACSALAAASVAGPCPPPITGEISGAGNRIPLRIEVVGPNGVGSQEGAILDTGGVQSFLLDADLRTAGFNPTSSYTTSLGGWTGVVNVYQVPSSALLVLDGSTFVPLADGSLTVRGGPPEAFNGIEPLIGPDVLQQGARLTTSGSSWSLTPYCGT